MHVATPCVLWYNKYVYPAVSEVKGEVPTVERILPCRGGKSVMAHLSDRKKVRISREMMARLALEPGMEAPEELLRRWEEGLTPERARNIAARIAMRPVFAAEVEKKLSERGFPPQTVSDTVAWLGRIGAVDDRETLRICLREGVRKGKGVKTLRYELLRRGASAESVEDALASYDGKEGALLMLEKKLKGKSDRDSLRRGAAFLYAKGFERSDIPALIGEYREKHPEQGEEREE